MSNPEASRNDSQEPTDQIIPGDSIRADETIAAGGDQVSPVLSPSTQADNNPAPSASTAMIGKLGKYRLLRKLGEGGMGVVYLAFDEKLHRDVALKVMLPKAAENPTARERFLREARAAARISSDHVVMIHEADEIEGTPYIAQQYLQGAPLDQYLKRKGQPGILQSMQIARETALGLAAAHQLGLVHRDIKPGNIWLEAPNGRVKILDFGLAKPVEDKQANELTASGAVVGTPAYMAPEQGQGLPLDGRADLFSLGCVLYRLVTGKIPFDKPTLMSTLMAIATEDPTPVRQVNPEVPDGLADLIQRLMSKKPENRPASALAVAKELQLMSVVLRSGGKTEPPQTEKTQANFPQATPLQSTIQTPQVVYVPVPTEALPNPFSEISESGSEQATDDKNRPSSGSIVAKRPKVKTGGGRGNPLLWVTIAAVLVGMMFLTLGGIVAFSYWSKSRHPGETAEGDDPKGDGKAGSKIAGKHDERIAAEWVLEHGGKVQFGPNRTWAKTPIELPPGDGPLYAIYLDAVSSATDKEMTRFEKCPHLEQISLKDCKVGDEGIQHLSNNPHILHWELDRTLITDKALSSLRKNPEIQSLSLRKTAISDTGLRDLQGLTKITTLHLDGTKITDSAIDSIKTLPALSSLTLCETQISEAGVKKYPDLARLRSFGAPPQTSASTLQPLEGSTMCTSLSFDECDINAEMIQLLSSLPNLHELTINQCQLGTADLARLKESIPECKMTIDGVVTTTPTADAIAAAAILKLGGTIRVNPGQRELKALPVGPIRLIGITLKKLPNLKDDDLAPLQKCRHLDVIVIDGAPITDRGLAFIKQIEGVKQLSLLQTKASGAGMARFSACKNLEALSLEGTNLDDVTLLKFKELKKLHHVSLSSPAITDTGAAAFAGCSKLESLTLQGPGVTGKCLNAYASTPLKKLSLNGTKTTDESLAKLAKLTTLQEVLLDNTLVTGTGVKQLAASKGLQSLSLMKVSLDPDSLSELKLLFRSATILHDKGKETPFIAGKTPDRQAAEYTLTMGGKLRIANSQEYLKKIEDLPAEDFKIEEVDFQGCKNLTHRDMQVFLGCKHIREINMDHAEFEADMGIGMFRDSDGVEAISVQGTMSGDSVLATLELYPNLKKLNLSNTEITVMGVGRMSAFKKLESLNLSNTKIDDSCMHVFKECKQLRNLYLNGTSIGNLGLANFKGNTKMQSLVLFDTAITDAGLAMCKLMPDLSILWVNDTKISDASLAHLANCSKLASLRLQGTKVTETKVKELSKQLPKCKIEWAGGVLQQPPK